MPTPIITPMMLNLPLCPKCGDTKQVEKCPTVMLIVTSTQYRCNNCNVHWWASPGNSSGTIEVEK